MSNAAKVREIRGVFVEIGGARMRPFVEILQARGVYSDDDVANFAIRGMMSDARKAINEPGPDSIPGLPLAAPDYTDGAEDDEEEDKQGGPTWKTLPLFKYAGIEILLTKRGKGILDDYAVLVRLRDYCLARFGKAPEIVEILEPTAS